MNGQGTIVAAGSIAYPPEWTHADPARIAQLGVSKVMTLTSTYDHRIIQGAESGNFLKTLDGLIGGGNEFYEKVATDLGLEASVLAASAPKASLAPPLSAESHTTGSAIQPRADPGTAPGGPGGDLAAQGLPHPRPPGRPPRPARRQAEGRSRHSTRRRSR